MKISIDAGPANVVNVPFVSVTLCSPGSTTNCQTIDHVIVDTGSYGLRIFSSVLSPGLNLPQRTDSSGNPLVECAQFADGYTWGPVKVADAQFSGETATSLAIQVIGDPGFSSVPGTCSNVGVAENTVQAFGGNGILGVGLFQQDCGSACAQAPQTGFYYACSSGSCTPVQVALTQQITNPVDLFAIDNNGVVVVLPSVGAAGAANISGSLIFGIGTQSNNALGNAAIFQVNASNGTLSTKFNNRSYSSFIDSGSNALFFPDGYTAICTGNIASGFYCPVNTQQWAAAIGTNGGSGAVNFSVANAEALFNNNPLYTSFSNLAGPSGSGLGRAFDWGLPFFYGRTIFTALENKPTPGGTGPFFAY
jgi:hypothetical protein